MISFVHKSRHEAGSVGVEMAVVLMLILLPILVGALYFGRFHWHYTVAEKAAHDAARFFASASVTEMKTVGPSGEAYIVGATKALAQAEIAELNPSPTYPPLVYVYCDGGPCVPFRGVALPRIVSVYVTMSVEDPFFTPLSALFSNDGNPLAIQIVATGSSAYAGN